MDPAKQRYFKKVFDAAPIIECACGCGTRIKSKDEYARDRKFVSGHNGRKYENPTQYKREWNHRNRKSRFQYKVNSLHKLKADIVLRLGGKCACCGLEYDGKNACVFDLHHIRDKEFSLSQGNLNKYSREKIWAEVEKCKLLCANCHRRIHFNEY